MTEFKLFFARSIVAGCVVALLTTPYLVWVFGGWGLVFALDIALGIPMVLIGAWAVWRVGLTMDNSLWRWGAWWGGAIGIAFTMLLGSAEAVIIGGHPAVLIITATLGLVIVPLGISAGLLIGVLWSSILRQTGRGHLQH